MKSPQHKKILTALDNTTVGYAIKVLELKELMHKYYEKKVEHG